MKQASYENE